MACKGCGAKKSVAATSTRVTNAGNLGGSMAFTKRRRSTKRTLSGRKVGRGSSF